MKMRTRWIIVQLVSDGTRLRKVPVSGYPLPLLREAREGAANHAKLATEKGEPNCYMAAREAVCPKCGAKSYVSPARNFPGEPVYGDACLHSWNRSEEKP